MDAAIAETRTPTVPMDPRIRRIVFVPEWIGCSSVPPVNPTGCGRDRADGW
jgi:hypothetical protein